MQKKDLQILLGKRIAELRKQRKFSQVEFAYMLDKEKQNYNKIEKGKANPTIWTLFQIAHILDVPVVELFKWDTTK
jgi:transcriptional regulator with XRE-family HTH domain